jgi:hypothetical protein
VPWKTASSGTANGHDLQGPELERHLQQLGTLQKHLQRVERRGVTRDIVLALLGADVRDASTFADRTKVDALAATLRSATRDVSVQADEEHNASMLVIEDRSAGYVRQTFVGVEFVTAPDYRTLVGSYTAVKDYLGAVVIRTLDATLDADGDAEGTDADADAVEAPATGSITDVLARAETPAPKAGGEARQGWRRPHRIDGRPPRLLSSPRAARASPSVATRGWAR